MEANSIRKLRWNSWRLDRFGTSKTSMKGWYPCWVRQARSQNTDDAQHTERLGVNKSVKGQASSVLKQQKVRIAGSPTLANGWKVG